MNKHFDQLFLNPKNYFIRIVYSKFRLVLNLIAINLKKIVTMDLVIFQKFVKFNFLKDLLSKYQALQFIGE